MKAIGHGGPRTQAGLEWPAPVIVLEALARFVSPETIRSVLTQTGRKSQRIRRLPATAVVWLAIAIGIWTDRDIPAIWRQVVGTLRSLFLALDAKHPPCKSALSQARTRLGPCAMRHPASRLACVRRDLRTDRLRSNTRGLLQRDAFDGHRRRSF